MKDLKENLTHPKKRAATGMQRVQRIFSIKIGGTEVFC